VNALPIIGVLAYAVSKAVPSGGVQLPSGSVSAQAGQLLSFAVLCGLASYATIETLKRVVRVRGHYQRWQTRRWLSRGSVENKAFDQLLSAFGLDRESADSLQVFNLPTEQLAAQIGAAADVALAAPRGFKPLILSLTGPLPEKLLKYLGSAADEQPLQPTEDDTSRLPDDDTSLPPTDDERAAEFQLAQRIRLGVDRLQISLTDQWRRTVQGAALWIAGLYGIGLVHAAGHPEEAEASYVLAALLLGGPIAWIVRDFAALVERARRT